MALTVGVVFGGASPEHEVSVISGLQAAAALDGAGYDLVPVYIAKSGRWYTGEGLFDIERYQDLDALVRAATEVVLSPREGRGARLVGGPRGLFARPTDVPLDALLLVLHGGAGESGAVQGWCEALGVPYTGSGVLGSALGMDKALTKMVCRDQGIPVVDWAEVREGEWVGREDEHLDRLEGALPYPMIVKPARLGSSIGIARAADRAALDAAVEDALRYDEKVVVERAVTALREINCSVLGTPQAAEASVLEQPVRSGDAELLTFAEKYQRGGSAKGAKGAPAPGAKAPGSGAGGMASLDRLIPAPIPEAMADEIRALAVRVFRLFECSGVARIDFLVDDADGEVYFNEINTIPGSLSYYLWEPAGVPFRELLERLIEQALQRHQSEGGRLRTFETNLLSQRSLAGLKGAKGG